jgi:hypothetical protein
MFFDPQLSTLLGTLITDLLLLDFGKKLTKLILAGYGKPLRVEVDTV